MHKLSSGNYRALIAAALLLVALIAHPDSAAAQVITNPHVIEFSPSADHNSLLPDGRPVVDHYVVGFFYQGASSPFQTNSLGKPAPGSNGLIQVDLATAVLPWPLGPGTVDEARVEAVGPGGTGQSSPSNLFAFSSPSCAYSLSTTAVSLPAAGGTGSVTVNTVSGCAWAATSNAAWITVTLGGSMTGTGFANFSVAANTSASARTGTLTIAGQVVSVTQAGTTCAYTLSSTALSVASTAGTASVGVTAATGCSWTAASNTSWLTISSGSSGTANGTVTFAMTANPSTSPRTGTLTVAGQTVAVTQAPNSCSYSLSTNTVTLAAAGGSGTVGVTAGSSCTWSAISNASWLTVTAGSGSGAGTLTFSAAANQSTTGRTATITVGNQTVTVTQAGTSCSCTLTTNAVSLASTAGSGQVGVSGPSGCAWTSSSNASWIAITSDAGSSGTGTVQFAVTANTSSSARTGTLTVAGQAVAVTQAAGTCTLTLSSLTASIGAGSATTSIGVTGATGCSWTAVSNATWLTIVAGNSGSGSGTVTISAVANPSSSPRTGTVTIAGQTVTVTQAAAGCTFTLSTTVTSIGATTGTGSIGVTTTAGCSWTASSNAAWMTVTTGAGSGSGTVTFSVAANPSTSPRSGTLTIAGQTVTVTQDGAVSSTSWGGTYTRTFSTYVGGTSDDADQGVFVDKSGNEYIVGGYNGTSFPATLNTCGNADSILAKFSPTGALAWSRCIGGSAKDYIHSALIDGQGSVFISGVTFSTDFPTTPGAYQTMLRGTKDVFIMKLSSTGAVIWSTLLGGSGDDHDRSSLALDSVGNLYVSGATRSTDFPVTPGAFQTVNKGGNDGYVAKLSADGRSLLASTYFGGSGDDTLLSGVYVHSDGTVYAGGFTASTDIPVTAGAFQRTFGGGGGLNVPGDGLIVRFNSTLSGLVFATYLGGNGNDSICENHGFRVDAAGRPIVAGHTTSTNLPVSATAVQRTYRGNGDTYVGILASNGQSLVALSYLGGSGPDLESGVDFDSNGNVYVTGETQSTDFPLIGALKSTPQSTDMTISVLSPDLSRLTFSTLYGGSGIDRGRGIAVTGGRMVVSGDSYSADFPVTAGAYQTKPGGMRDLVLLSLTPSTTTTPPACTITVTPTSWNFPASGGSAIFTVASSASTCTWSAAGSSWLSVTPTTGTGSRTVTVTAAPNTLTSPRTLAISIAGQTVSVTQAGTSCTFTLSSGTIAVASTAGGGSVAVTASSGCTWTAASNTAWITVTSGSTTSGSGAVGFSVTANPSTSPRTGTLTVAGQVVTVTQAGASCGYTLSTNALLLSDKAGTASVAVTAPAGCSWTSTSNAGWITVTGGASGTASGTVTLSVTANTSASSRTGTLTIAGQPVTVTQSGVSCTYTLSAPGQRFTSAGGTGSVGVTTSATQCTWSASSAAGWITLTGGTTGTGAGTVNYTAAPNTGTSDVSATLSIAGLTYTITVAAASTATRTVNVSTEPQLQSAVQSLTSNTVIVMARGTYALTRTLAISGSLTNIALRGATLNPADVVLVGSGMNNASSGTVAEGITTAGTIDGLTVANLTLRDVYLHAVHFGVGTHAPQLANVRLLNAGQSFVLADVVPGSGAVDDGVVEDSLFERLEASRDANTTAIDVQGGARWQIRRNLFRNLGAPAGQTGSPAVLMRAGASGTLTEQNTFVNCQRGIAYGWTDRTGFDHSGGVIRNNFIYRSATQPGEAAIMVYDSPNTKVLHNTVLLSGTYQTPIEYRYPDTVGVLIANNLLDGSIWARDGAMGVDSANDVGARPAYFVNAAMADLHLAPGSPAVDRAAVLPTVLTDWDGDPRPAGAAADMGADEASAPNQPPIVAIFSPANGSTFATPGSVVLSVVAADPDGRVARVDYYANSVLIGSATAAPFDVTWKTRLSGSIKITAVATDDSGASTTSPPITLTAVKKGN